MPTNETALLRDLISRLDQKPFDLQAWKTNAVLILGRIFGETSRKSLMINNIQPDFSSWSLRDATGRITQLDACRKMGREIIEASIAELEAFGVPEKSDKNNPALTALEEFITVKQSRELAELIASDLSTDVKSTRMTELLTNLEQKELRAALVKILVNQ